MRLFYVVSMTLILYGSSIAHTGDRAIPIMRLSDEQIKSIDLHDGTVADWEAILGPPTLTPQDLTVYSGLAPYDPADMDYKIWMAWHKETNRIYVAMEKFDDHYIVNLTAEYAENDPIAPWYSDSALNFFIDGDHQGGTTIYGNGLTPNSERLNDDNRESQYFLAMGENLRDDNRQIALWKIDGYVDQHWFVSPPFAEGGGGSSPDKAGAMVTEFYITPFDELVWDDASASTVSELNIGQTIGFALYIRDFDLQDDFSAVKSVHHLPDHRWGVTIPADEFIDGILLDLPEASRSPTAVGRKSWARIKASLEAE